MRLLAILLPLLLLTGTADAVAEDAPCGPDAPCAVEGGDYYLQGPAGWDGKSQLPVLLFFHGHNASGKMIFTAESLKAGFVDHGYLIVAPNGAIRPGRNVRGWPGRRQSAPGERDDLAFVSRVMDDVGKRLPLDRSRLFVAGFSAGGSMAWLVACYAGQDYKAFTSIAGALRRPIPDDGHCPAGPLRLLQIHGFTDAQVPLEGRGIGDWHQGDVFESLNLARATDRCRSNPDLIEPGQPYRCRNWTSCETGALRLCLHDGGHGMPKGWADLARAWFEGPRETQAPAVQ